MLRREDGHHIDTLLQENIQQMLVSYHARMIGEEGNALALQEGEVDLGLLVAHYHLLSMYIRYHP